MAEGVPRGGEERLEDASLDLGRDSRPIVRHLENDLPPRGVVAGGDCEAAGALHLAEGMVGIGHEVDQHLVAIGAPRRRRR